MVEVTIQILHCDLPVPDYHYIVYNIKTFWCKNKMTVCEKLQSSKLLALPILPLHDYLSFVSNGKDVTIFVEVSFCHNDDVFHPSKCDKLVGVAMTKLNQQIENPNMNPVWQFLPIENIIKNTTEGKIYVKISALKLGGYVDAGGKCGDIMKSYFSSSSGSNPALVCPPHLVDHISFEPSNGEEISNSNKKSNNASSAVSRHSDHNKMRDEERPKSLEIECKSPRKPDPIVAHNMCSSQDFPFKIPAVEEDEKRKKMIQKMAKLDDDSASDSMPLFPYTPKTPFLDKNRIPYSANQFQEHGDPESPYVSHVKHDRGLGVSKKPHDEIKDIILALNESFDKSLGHQVEQIKEKKLANEMLNERKSTRADINFCPPTKDDPIDRNTRLPNPKVSEQRNSRKSVKEPVSVKFDNVHGPSTKKYKSHYVQASGSSHSQKNAKENLPTFTSSRLAANFS